MPRCEGIVFLSGGRYAGGEGEGIVGREGGRVIWVGEEKREGRRRMGI